MAGLPVGGDPVPGGRLGVVEFEMGHLPGFNLLGGLTQPFLDPVPVKLLLFLTRPALYLQSLLLALLAAACQREHHDSCDEQKPDGSDGRLSGTVQIDERPEECQHHAQDPQQEPAAAVSIARAFPLAPCLVKYLTAARLAHAGGNGSDLLSRPRRGRLWSQQR
jgi:hypothetical protein